MKNKIIAFNGNMGVGKSTAIEIIRELEEDTRLVKFAQPLYDIQEAIYTRINSVYTRPETFIKDRKLLQWLGTEWGRGTISQSLWVDIWKARAEELLSANLVVCDDVRFDNEAHTIKSMGGIIIRIVSDNTDQRIDTKAGISNHSSEAGIHPGYVDHTINNNSTLESFQDSLRKLFKELRVGEET